MAVDNLSYASGKAGSITLRKNGVDGVELYSPYANTFNMNITSDVDYAMAQGNRAVRFNSNKQATIELELDIFEIKLLGIIFGMNPTTGATSIFARETFTAPGTTITLDATPAAGSQSVYILEADNVGHDYEVTEGDPVNPGEYEITGDTITLNATEGALNVVVYYTKDSAADAVRWDLEANEWPSGYTLDFVSVLTSKYDGALHNVNIVARNANPTVDATISFSEGTHSTLSISWDLFPDANEHICELIQLD